MFISLIVMGLDVPSMGVVGFFTGIGILPLADKYIKQGKKTKKLKAEAKSSLVHPKQI